MITFARLPDGVYHVLLDGKPIARIERGLRPLGGWYLRTHSGHFLWSRTLAKAKATATAIHQTGDAR